MADEKALGNFEAVEIARDDDAGCVGLGANDVAEELDAVHAGHGEVGDDDVKGTFLEELDAFLAAGGGGNFVYALESRGNTEIEIPQGRIVINKENAIVHEPPLELSERRRRN